MLPDGRAAAPAVESVHPDPIDEARPAIAVFRDKDGLPQNAAMAMAFDPQGYLWIGTQDGLARYDGHEWSVVNLPNRTESNFVRSMVFASDGALWCGREIGGVARLKDGRWDTWDEAQGGPRGRVDVVFEEAPPDQQPAIWVGTSNGLYRFADGAWRNFTMADGLPSNDVNDMVVADGPGGEPQLWIATDGGLARRDGTRFVPIDIPGATASEGVQCVARTTDGANRTQIWAAPGVGKLAVFADGAWRVLAIATTDSVTCIAGTLASDASQTIWIGTDSDGLLQLRNGALRVFDTTMGVPNNSVWSLLPVDTPGGTTALWIGTDGGAGRMEFGRWLFYDTANGLPTNSAYAFALTDAPDERRALWVGTRGGNLARLEDAKWTTFGAESGLPSRTVFSLLYATNDDGSRTLWAGTQGAGIARFTGDRWVPVVVPDAPRSTVRTMIETTGADGKREIWAATGNTGLLHYRASQWTRIDTTAGLGTLSLFSVLETHLVDGRRALWVGTQGHGLGLLVGNEWTHFDTGNSQLPNNSVLSLHEHLTADGHRQLWAGTEGGGVTYIDLDNPDSPWTVMSDATTPALPNNTAYQIQEDSSGRLYVFTNKGCARLTPRRVTDDDPSQFDVYVFRTEDGLPSNEFNGGASMVDAFGRIWAGTPAGVAVLDPARAIDDTRPRQLYLSGGLTREGGARIAAGQSLRYNQNGIVFEYNLVSYFREKDTRYRTQLVGLEDVSTDWSPDFKRSFTALPDGPYVFRVWGRDYSGNVTGPVELAFEIRPAPWRTWWAYVLYVLAFGALVYVIVWARLKALRRRNEELEEGIAERTAQLAEKVEELEVSERTAQAAKDEALHAKEEALDANRAKSVFLSNMSHELRTPLNAVLGFAQLMERDEGRPSEDRENLAIIMRSGEHLLGLINDVLSISKIEAGKLTLNEQTFDVRRLLQGLEEMLGSRAHAKGLRMVFDLAPDIPQYVRGDDGKLRQVLINLLNNAVKFTEAGGIALRAEWTDGRARFEVEDTGKGIADDEIGGIFEAFVQSETGRTAKEGTGLGLAISRNFVHLMGGDITVRSQVGEGTVFAFDVKLPLAETVDQPRPLRRVRALEAPYQGTKVLVVDDRWENRALLVKMLRTVGFDVREAANGREAVDQWEAWRPALIWMDMRMPVMDGRAATREIRRLEPDGERCRILALTASAFEHERGAVLAAGCDDFVTKPYRESTIWEKLESHLGVAFDYEEPDAEPVAISEAALTPARFAAVPSDMVEELQAALVLGNVKDAQFVVDNIAPIDQALADDLRRLVRSYQFDEILDAIEACGIK